MMKKVSLTTLMILFMFLATTIVVRSSIVFNSSDPNQGHEEKAFFRTYLQFRYLKFLKPLNARYPMLQIVPAIFNKFDWILWQPEYGIDKKTGSDPKTVLAHVDMMNRRYFDSFLRNLLNLKELQNNEQRVIVFAGGDYPASNCRKHLETLIERKVFSTIWFEAKNVEIEGVKTIPSGLDSRYLMKSGLKNVISAIKNVDLLPDSNRSLVCVAFGAMFKTLDEQSNRKELIEMINGSSWLTRSLWPADQYWHEFSKFKFMIAPHGNGMQSAKFWECIMARVIPVTVYTSGFADLKNMGFPLLLVNKWSEITPDLLNDWYENHGKKLNWTHIRDMLKIDNIMKIIKGEDLSMDTILHF